MPVKIPALTPLYEKLGLRAPYTKKAEDWRASPAVAALWTDLGKLCDRHIWKEPIVIRHCPEVDDAQTDLLNEHGPRIWKEADGRPWLLLSGEEPSYQQDLKWENLEHQEFIRKTFRTLAVAKILSRRKHKGQGSQDASDNGSDPSYTPAPSTANPHPTNHGSRTRLRCFNTSQEGHNDALGLWDSIWLGDNDQPQLSLNGKSWIEIQEDYFERSQGGKACHGVEPYCFDEARPRWIEYMQCVACEKAGRPCEKLKGEVLELKWQEKASNTTLEKNIWSVHCYYEGREVKALLKEMPERERLRLGYERPIWQFWKLNGGYTTDRLLTDVPQNATTPLLQSDVLPANQDKGKRKRQESAELDDQIHDRTQSLPKRITRSRTSGAALGISAFSPINGRHAGPSTQPHGQSDSRPNQDRGQSFDSLYDTTPAPQSSTRIADPERATQNATQSIFQRCIRPRNEEEHGTASPDTQAQSHQASALLQERPPPASTPNPAATTTTELVSEPQTPQNQDNEPPQPPAPTSGTPPQTTGPEPLDIEIIESKPIPRSSSTMDPPPFTLRFPIWLKTGETAKVVWLDDSMTVQDVFTRLRKNLRRQIEGKKLLAINLRFEVEGQALITVDEDDEDGWEMVLKVVEKAEKKEMYGNLEVE
ncbi:hypothetical protein HII31_10779 [Pseudocercospora fuligena]|uniref:Uncharacterized protein n=1 Tax=Pseudocercospora fuligena TaxID=685502 RepID=A0A8H6RBG4_9PEZI|nr:hypothetical protein HII31_10779 [Pseudocercospora fuligena]